MTLRPDELALQSSIERNKKFEGNVKKGVNAAITVGTSFLGAGLTSRILPLLSEHIPVDLAVKGISKLSPKLGEFLNKGMKMGLDAKEGLQSLKGEIEKSTEKPKETKNIIEKYSPELHQFMKEQVTSGRPVLEAGAIAQNDKRFKQAIDKLSKDHKTNWSNIIQGIYGSGEQSQSSHFQQKSQQMQGQQQGSGQGQQALMAIMQRINQRLGG